MNEKDILCINCAEEVLGREFTPDDFTPSAINLGVGGILSYFSAKGKWQSVDDKKKIEVLREKFKSNYGPVCGLKEWEKLSPEVIANFDLREYRKWFSAEQLENDWLPCSRCNISVWGDSGIDKGLKSGYQLQNQLWNIIWEKFKP